MKIAVAMGGVRTLAAMLSTLALVACGSKVTGSTSECSQQPDAKSCNACYAEQFDGGVAGYNDVASCVFCSACYTACQSASKATFCEKPPHTTDACDTGTPGTTACSACQACAAGASGSCGGAIQTCTSNPDCKALLGATCPE